MNAPEAAHVCTTDVFVTVPETTLPCGIVVPAFLIGQYACTQGEDGKAAVTADAAPWVDINYHEARAACEKAGYKAITELQWLAAAHNAATQDANWTGGKVGEGDLFQGIRNWTVARGRPGSYVSHDADERRWLTLSNGERICDLNGNVFQWVSDDVQGDENGVIARDFATDSPSITTAQFPSGTRGMGDYEVWDWSGRALVRGGCWYSGSNAGVFDLSGDWPVYRNVSVGFRCTKPIGL